MVLQARKNRYVYYIARNLYGIKPCEFHDLNKNIDQNVANLMHLLLSS